MYFLMAERYIQRCGGHTPTTFLGGRVLGWFDMYSITHSERDEEGNPMEIGSLTVLMILVRGIMIIAVLYVYKVLRTHVSISKSTYFVHNGVSPLCKSSIFSSSLIGLP